MLALPSVLEGVSEYTGKGGMVAWRLPLALASKLALPFPDAEQADDLHLTLCFFPDFSQVDTAKVEKVMQAVMKEGVLDGEIAGFGRFSASSTSDDQDVLYASVDVPGLEAMREELVAKLEDAGQEISHTHGFTPHITLMYLLPGAETPIDRIDHLPLTINSLILSSPGSEPIRVGAKAKRPDAHPFERQYRLDVAAYKLKVWKALERIHKNVLKEMRREGYSVKEYAEKAQSGVGSGAFWDSQYLELKQAVGTGPSRIMQAGALQAQSLGVLFDPNAVNTAILNYTATYTNKWWQDLEANTRDGLRSALADHIEQGTSLQDLSANIAQYFGEARAQRIAATEVTRLYAEGNSLAYQDAGISVEWQTVGDDLVDEDCQDLEGQQWPAGQEDEMPPLHENCRCWLAPVVDSNVLSEPVSDPAPAAFDIEQAPVQEEYKSFPNGGSAETWLADNAAASLAPSGLTDIQLGAVSDYRQSSVVNGLLRGTMETRSRMVEKLRSDITAIDEVLAKTAVPENVTVYRGIADVDLTGLLGHHPEIGDSFIDKGFISTTLNPEGVGAFTAGGKAPTVLEVRLPANSQALAIGDVPGIGHYYAPEQELLLPRNTRFTVVGQRADGVYILEAQTPNLERAAFQAESRSMTPGAIKRREMRATENEAQKAVRIQKQRDERARAAARRGTDISPPRAPRNPIPVPDDYGKRARTRAAPAPKISNAPASWTEANYKAKFIEAHPNQELGLNINLDDARAIHDAIKDMPETGVTFKNLTWAKSSDKYMSNLYARATGGRARAGEVRGVYTPSEHAIRINASAMPGGEFYGIRAKWSAYESGAAALRESISHEYGHALIRMKTGGFGDTAEIHALFRKGLFVSDYGKLSPAEWTAEVIARWYTGTGKFTMQNDPVWREVVTLFKKKGLIA